MTGGRDPRSHDRGAPSTPRHRINGGGTTAGGDEDLPEFEPLFDDSEPDFDGVEFWTDN